MSDKPETKPVLVCVDCKYGAPLCMKSPVMIDFVYGRKIHQTCYAMRSDENQCGYSAKWFEPKTLKEKLKGAYDR